MSERSEPASSLLGLLARSLAVAGSVAMATAGRRAAASLAGYAVVAVLFIVSVCFLTLAGYRAIVLALGDIHAALIVGCVYLVLGLTAALFVQTRR